MSYQELIARTWQHNLLFSVLVELTYTCNLNCFYCYNDRKQQGRPLSLAQYHSFFKDLKEMNVLHLILSGGEPLLHPDFFQIGARARELGFVIRIKSNGHALDAATVQRIRREITPVCIDISLHGATAAVHDRQTGVAGSFNRLLENMAILQECGQRFNVNTTLTSWNEGELAAMFALAESMGFHLHLSLEIAPGDDGSMKPLTLTPSATGKKEARRQLQIQRERQQENGENRQLSAMECRPAALAEKHCGAGSATIAVDPFGNVLPCVQWRQSTDNLHQQTIQEIWQHSATLNYAREVTEKLFLMAEEKEHGAWLDRQFCPALGQCINNTPLKPY